MPKASELAPSQAGVARLKAVAIERLEWARTSAEGVFAAIPDDKMTFRPGGAGNHLLWVMGHLGVVDDLVLNVQTGCTLEASEAYRKRFGINSQPVDDLNAYPPRAELLNVLRLHRRRLITWVQSLDDETAWKPSPDFFKPFAPDAISTPFGAAAHDLMHTGQITAVRAALGLSPHR